MSDAPRGRHRGFTDAELRKGLFEDGLSVAEFARRHGVTRQAVYPRLDQMDKAATAALVQPEESARFVRGTLDVLEEISRCVASVNRLLAACDGELRDPDDPREFYLGPTAEEVKVTYYEWVSTERGLKKAKHSATLQTLLDRAREGEGVDGIERTETRRADTRELLLKASAENRQLMATAADLARTLADARSLQTFRDALMEELSKEDPDFADRVARRLRAKLVLHNAVRGLEQVPG